MFRLERDDVLRAYFQTRKNKKETISVLKFEFELEKNISKLYFDILKGNYKTGKSSCIVVNMQSTPREIWTGEFRDKIVHRIICSFLDKIYKDIFYINVFNGIKSRGTK